MKYTKLEKIKYDGIDVKVGDLIFYETIINPVDKKDYHIKNFYYGIIQSINSYKTKSNKTKYKFDIKVVGSEAKPNDKEELHRIYTVCTADYFDEIIQDIKERAENTIKYLLFQLEHVKPDRDKQIKQYEELKALLKQ